MFWPNEESRRIRARIAREIELSAIPKDEPELQAMLKQHGERSSELSWKDWEELRKALAHRAAYPDEKHHADTLLAGILELAKQNVDLIAANSLRSWEWVAASLWANQEGTLSVCAEASLEIGRASCRERV